MMFPTMPITARSRARHPRAWRLGLQTLCILALALGFGSGASAQKLLDRDQPRTAAANDPYTRGGDAELVAAAGYVSLAGEFEFGPTGQTSKSISEYLSFVDIYWIETEHFRLGVSLGKVKVTSKERDKLREELTRLKEKLPDVEPKTRVLDPWLRAHLYAQRLEDHYARIQEFLGVTDEPFAELNGSYDPAKEYFGIGPYLGMRQKYELFVAPSEGAYREFMRNKLGLTTKVTQFWAYHDRDVLSMLTHTEQKGLRVDEALHGHITHSITHCLLSGYKHYSYDLPVWISEGCAHWFERGLNPRFNSFTASEGAASVQFSKEKWLPVVRKMATSGKLPSFPTMIGRRAFAELTLEDHLKGWAIVEFLMSEHPTFLPKYFGEIKSLFGSSGPDPSSMSDTQRKLFKDELGMSYAQFDRAFQEWLTGGDD